jgi:hypothetical protein
LREKQPYGRVHMSRIGAELAKLLLRSGDHAGDLSPLSG